MICHNTERDKFCSLASCWKSTLNVEHEDIPGAMMLSINKETFMPQPVNMLLLYRKNSTSLIDFSYLLSHFLSRCDDCIQVILGDFNVSAFDNHQVKDFLGNYTLIINQPTHLSGSLLDHVYVKNDFMNKISIRCIIKNIFFSDHDAVKFQLIPV